MTERKAVQALCLVHLEQVGKQQPGRHRYERKSDWQVERGERRKRAISEIALFFNCKKN